MVPLLLLLGAFWLGGCATLVDPEAAQEQHGQIIATLSPEVAFGQSFVSRSSGLNAVELWLGLEAGVDRSAGTLTATLYHAPGGVALATVHKSFAEIAAGSPLRIDFPPQADPRRQSYYLEITSDLPGVQVYGVPVEAYGDGTAYQSGFPMPADAAFRSSYRYGWSNAVSDLRRGLGDLWLVAPLWLALFLPGWLLLDLLGMRRHFSGGEQAALAVGLSLALVPLAMLWTGALGLRWGTISVRLVAGLLAGWAVVRQRGLALPRRGAARQAASLDAASGSLAEATPDPGAGFRPAGNGKPNGEMAAGLQGMPKAALGGTALLVVLLLAFATRLVMARDLTAPPWVDPVHHGVITRLILEQGRFPQSYAPLIDVDGARYHPGFHAVLATFRWLSGQDEPEAMLAFGQVLNTLVAVLAVYLLTTTLTHRPSAGALAAFLAAQFSPMPAYYTSWGRYTQLAGLLVLPAAFALLRGALAPQTIASARAPLSLAERRRWLLAGVLATAGLFLVHYRAAAFLGVLLVSDWLVRSVAGLRLVNRQFEPPFRASLRQNALLLGGGALLGLALLLPWLPEAWGSLFLPRLSSWSVVTSAWFSGFTWRFLTTAWGTALLALAGGGLLWGLVGAIRATPHGNDTSRRMFPFTLALWVGGLLLLANLDALSLPGAGFVNNTSVVITLFMPLALLGGYLLATWLDALLLWLPWGWIRPYRWVLLALLVVTGVFAARPLVGILNPVTFLFRQPDQRALAWIDANLPTDETVVINPFGWGYGLYGGADGGFWIAPLTGRATMPPPVLYGLDNDISRLQAVSQAAQKIIDLSADADALGEYLHGQGWHYVYIGAKGGVLSPQRLAQSDWFEVLYNQAGTWVLRVRETD